MDAAQREHLERLKEAIVNENRSAKVILEYLQGWTFAGILSENPDGSIDYLRVLEKNLIETSGRIQAAIVVVQNRIGMMQPSIESPEAQMTAEDYRAEFKQLEGREPTEKELETYANIESVARLPGEAQSPGSLLYERLFAQNGFPKGGERLLTSPVTGENPRSHRTYTFPAGTTIRVFGESRRGTEIGGTTEDGHGMILIVPMRASEIPVKKAAKTVTLTPEGTDVESENKDYDAHVRIETLPGNGTRVIMVDVFNSNVEDPNKAHIGSTHFPFSQEGAQLATDFLKGAGFDVKLLLP